MREESVETFYGRQCEAAKASTAPIQIFPSTSDADSLCALKILTRLPSTDSIRHAVYPISFFSPAVLATLRESPVSVLINWGSHRDLRRLLALPQSCRVFVVDSHRPFHLHNLSDQNQEIVVLHTRDDEDKAYSSYDFQVQELANASDLNSDDGLYDDNSDEDDDDSDSEDERGDRKWRRLSEGSVDDQVKLYRKLNSEYYKMGTFHGQPSGCLMFEIAHLLRNNNNELLWLA